MVGDVTASVSKRIRDRVRIAALAHVYRPASRRCARPANRRGCAGAPCRHSATRHRTGHSGLRLHRTHRRGLGENPPLSDERRLLFAITALVLTSLGLYSALSHATKRRTHEIGIRMALGAKPADIRRTVLAQALAPVATGIGAGFVVALGMAPLLRGLLFGISPSDPRVFALTAFVLGCVSVVAAYVPGLRASQVSPTIAMRSE